MKYVGFVALTVLLPFTSAFAQKPVALLPQTYIDTTFTQPVGGTTWAAHTSAQLSSALTSSQPGDVIVLDAGVTYSGYFFLPAKSNPNSQWIYIISSNYAQLPPAGTRVSPADAANMAKIVSPNTGSPFTVANGANHWRLVGLELTAQSNYPSGCPGNGQHCMTYFIMNLKSLSGADADYVWIDRCYAHGSPTQDFQAGIVMNWNHAALIDSYVHDIHIKTFDSIGTGAYHTLGPIKIVNNYVSAPARRSLAMIAVANDAPTNWPFIPRETRTQANLAVNYCVYHNTDSNCTTPPVFAVYRYSYGPLGF